MRVLTIQANGVVAADCLPLLRQYTETFERLDFASNEMPAPVTDGRAQAADAPLAAAQHAFDEGRGLHECLRARRAATRTVGDEPVDYFAQASRDRGADRAVERAADAFDAARHTRARPQNPGAGV